MEFRASGDTGLTVVLGDRVCPETSVRVLGLQRAVEAARLPGVIELVPSYLSLLIQYDPLATSQAAIREALRSLDAIGLRETEHKGASWAFPICFEGEGFAPDLDAVASHADVAPHDVIDAILEAQQIVYMLGFAPGQPYLGDLPERFAIPRRMTPVPDVPAGSVLTATGKTVIYPNANPTGWYVIGRTPVPLFDMSSETPALLTPGDVIGFRNVGLEEYRDIEAGLKAGAIDAAKAFAQ